MIWKGCPSSSMAKKRGDPHWDVWITKNCQWDKLRSSSGWLEPSTINNVEEKKTAESWSTKIILCIHNIYVYVSIELVLSTQLNNTSQNWHLPNRDENTKYLKPPPIYVYGQTSPSCFKRIQPADLSKKLFMNIES